MATHASTLAWKIPWTEEPGRLQSMGSLRVGHDWATSLSCIGEGNGNPLQYSCLGNPKDGGAWWAAVYGVTQSQTWLKRRTIQLIMVHWDFMRICTVVPWKKGRLRDPARVGPGSWPITWEAQLLRSNWQDPSLSPDQPHIIKSLTCFQRSTLVQIGRLHSP